MAQYTRASSKSYMTGIEANQRRLKKIWEEEKRRKAAEFAQLELNKKIESGELNPDGTEKEGPRNIFEHLASFGTDLLAGTQQMAGKVADATIKGTAVLESIANDTNPFINDKQREERRREILARAEGTRDFVVQNRSDVRGNNLTGTKDTDDITQAVGEGLDVALGATMFANPLRLAAGVTRPALNAGARDVGSTLVNEGLRPAARAVFDNARSARQARAALPGLTGREVAKFAARDASFFGALDATATAVNTYGETRDIGESLKQGAQAGLLSGATAGLLDIGGATTNRAISRSISKIKDSSKNTTRAAEQAIAALPEDIPNRQAVIEQINTAASEARNVGMFKTRIRNMFNEEAAAPTPRQESQEVIGEERQPASGIRRIEDNDADIERLRRGEDESVMRDMTDEEVAAEASRVQEQINEIDAQLNEVETSGQNVEPELRSTLQSQREILETQLRELETGVDPSNPQTQNARRVVDENLAQNRFNELQAERRSIQDNDIRMRGSDSATLQAEIDDLNNGVVPDEFVITRDPVDNSTEAMYRAMRVDPEDQLGIQEVYLENQTWRRDANEQLSRLMTQERFDQYQADLDDGYNAARAEISQMPKPRQEVEIARLDEQYASNLSRMQEQLANDAQRVEELKTAIRVADDIDANITDEWNSLEQSNPVLFGDVDQASLDNYRQSLERVRDERLLQEEGGMSNNPVDRQSIVQNATANDTNPAQVKRTLDGNDSLYLAARETIADAAGDIGKDPTPMDWLIRLPRKTLERMGPAGVKIRDVAAEAIYNINKFNGDIQARTREHSWRNATKGRYADQTVDFLESGKPLKKGLLETNAHFAKRQEAADDIKAWLQEVGRKLGLPEDVVTRDYYPHLIEKRTGLTPDEIAETLARLESGINAKGNKLTENQRRLLERKLQNVDMETRQFIASKKLYQVENGHMKRRAGAEGWSRDLGRVLSEYARTSANDIYLKPALREVNDLSVNLNKDQQAWLNSWVKQWRGRTGDFDAAMERAKIPGTNISVADAVGGARRLQNVSLMGASARTILMQTGAMKNIMAEALGEGFEGQILQSGLRALAASNPNSKLRLEMYREGGFANSWSGYIGERMGISGKATKFEKAMYSGITGMDELMRLWAYDLGKQGYARRIGKDVSQLNAKELAEAKKMGLELADRTSFNMSALDIPVAQGTQTGKFFTQLQQFNLRDLGFNRRLIIGEGRRSLIGLGEGDFRIAGSNIYLNRKGAKRVLGALIGYGILVGTLTSAGAALFGDGEDNPLNILGLDAIDFLPFGEQVEGMVNVTGQVIRGEEVTAEIPVPSVPLLSAIFGGSFGEGILSSGGGAIEALRAHQRGEIDDQELNAALSKFGSILMRNFLPGGTQLNRTLQGATALSEGMFRNGSGDIRFLVNQESGLEIIRSLVGGPYATREGQKWLNDKISTIPKNATVDMPDGSKVKVSDYVRKLSREDQAQFVGYYSTKKRASDMLSERGESKRATTDSIRQRLTDGLITPLEAQREAEKWNIKVLNLYSPYLSGNRNIPARLTDDLLSNVLIDTSSLRPIRERVMSEEEMDMLESYYYEELGY